MRSANVGGQQTFGREGLRCAPLRPAAALDKEVEEMKRFLLVVVIGLIVSPGLVADPPGQSGPNVFRIFSVTVGWSISDFKTGWQAIHGVDVREWCLIPGCTDDDPNTECTAEFDVVGVQAVFLPDAISVTFNGEEVRTWVYPFPQFDCDMFLGIDPVATGMATATSTDNSFNGTGSRANSWGIVTTGTLQSADGDMRFNSLARCVASATRFDCTDHVNLH